MLLELKARHLAIKQLVEKVHIKMLVEMEALVEPVVLVQLIITHLVALMDITEMLLLHHILLEKDKERFLDQTEKLVQQGNLVKNQAIYILLVEMVLLQIHQQLM